MGAQVFSTAGGVVLFCALALAGCATGKEKVQDFVDCLEVGMSLEQMEKLCVPRLDKQAVYVRQQSNLFHEEVRHSCAQTTVLCNPTNLSELLHLDYSPPATKEYPRVQEPYALVRTEFIGIGGQAVMIFYSRDAGRIIGWIAKGL